MESNELVEYVEQSQSLIDVSPQMDEQNTRRKLIEPLLELLGWDMLSPEVELEYSVQMGVGTKKVDYALMLEGTPVVFVEAKGIDSSITDSHRSQLKSYMRQTGVDWGLLTNGVQLELLKRKKGGSRPDEVSLGTFSLDELPDDSHYLRALSRESIETGEAERIAENIEATQKAATHLQENKESLANEITRVVTADIDDSVSQTVQDGAKQFIDVLASTLKQQGKDEIQFEWGERRETKESTVSEWTPSENKNAIAGTISRAELTGDANTQVAIFPTHESGIKFLQENNAWGFVRVGSEFEYVAMYVTGDVRQVKYFATVKDVVPPEEAELSRPIEEYADGAKIADDKMVIRFQPASLYELENPVPYETKYPQGLRYTTLGALRTAETTDDIF